MLCATMQANERTQNFLGVRRNNFGFGQVALLLNRQCKTKQYQKISHQVVFQSPFQRIATQKCEIFCSVIIIAVSTKFSDFKMF